MLFGGFEIRNKYFSFDFFRKYNISSDEYNIKDYIDKENGSIRRKNLEELPKKIEAKHDIADRETKFQELIQLIKK